MNRAGQAQNRDSGYAMAALLVAIAVMAIAMTVAMPAWRQAGQREKEEELIFRGRQYVRGIQLYQRKYAATYPADVDILVKQKFLRKKYKDPMVADGEFDILYQGSLVSIGQGRGGLPQGQGQGQAQDPGRGGATTFTFESRPGGVTQAGQTARTAGQRGGVLGVRSKSTDASIRSWNGATHYNEWRFLFMPAMAGPGQGRPGMRGGRGGGQGGPGMPGMPGGRGAGPGGENPSMDFGDPGLGSRGGRGGQRGQEGQRPGGVRGPGR